MSMAGIIFLALSIVLLGMGFFGANVDIASATGAVLSIAQMKNFYLLLGGVIVALADAEMAGILQRYFADFSFMFLAAVVLLVFIVNENLQPGSTVQNLLMKVLLVLVAVSVLYSALLCFVPETGWYSDVYPWAYRDIIETAQFWT